VGGERVEGEGGGPGEFEDRDWELDDHDWSDKAWMSVTDADLFEAILLRKGETAAPLEVLEWGSGKSTFYYTGVLSDAGIEYRWLSLEYDRDFFQEDIAPRLDELGRATVHYVTDAESRDLRLGGGEPTGQSVEFVVFDKGTLKPMLRSGKADRRVDMDAYVAFPGLQDRSYDLVLVDGRKRRRCLLEARQHLADRGVALLHDAWRPYYHCAFDAYRSQRRVGDILWLGTESAPAYLETLLGGLT
jgi:hypothetical protein